MSAKLSSVDPPSRSAATNQILLIMHRPFHTMLSFPPYHSTWANSSPPSALAPASSAVSPFSSATSGLAKHSIPARTSQNGMARHGAGDLGSYATRASWKRWRGWSTSPRMRACMRFARRIWGLLVVLGLWYEYLLVIGKFTSLRWHRAVCSSQPAQRSSLYPRSRRSTGFPGSSSSRL